jgi:23S rRNA (cytosine1962-C5)-methyltransferase
MTYQLIDSGEQTKIEKFGDVTLVRPCAQAVWPRQMREVWNSSHAVFSRDPGGKWQVKKQIPKSWVTELFGIKFKLEATDFGHVGLFPEHAMLWEWMVGKIRPGSKILNLFAYTGGATLAAAKAGAEVCHLDASKTSVAWARENAALNGLEGAPIRWIVDDVLKFLKREIRRGVKYDGIILDPPTYGRGRQGEVFKIEDDLKEILECCRQLLSDRPLFVILSCHTPGYTPIVLGHILGDFFKGKIESGEMIISAGRDLPSGAYARWYV